MRKGMSLVFKGVITLIGCGVIYFLLRDKWTEVVAIVRECDIPFFLGAIVLFNAAAIIAALRLQVSLRMYDVSLPLLAVCKINYLGYFFNNFFPSSVGGDVAKGFYVVQYGHEKARSFIAIFVDRIVGLFSVFCLCMISGVILYTTMQNPVILVVISVLFLGGLFLIFFFTHSSCANFLHALHIKWIPQGIMQMIKKIYFMIHECKEHKRLIMQAFMWSCVFQILSIFAISVAGYSLGIRLALPVYYMLTPLVFVFSMIPSINGLGVREGAYIYFFSFFIPREQAFALSIFGFMLLYTECIVGFFLYIFHRRVSLKDLRNAEDAGEVIEEEYIESHLE